MCVNVNYYSNQKKNRIIMTISAIRNIKIEILLIPCIIFRLKDDGSSAGRGFQKVM